MGSGGISTNGNTLIRLKKTVYQNDLMPQSYSHQHKMIQ